MYWFESNTSRPDDERTTEPILDTIHPQTDTPSRVPLGANVVNGIIHFPPLKS